MKIAFISNYLNHHQLPCCLEYQRQTHGNFVFIATTDVPRFRKDLGYRDMNHEYDFVVCSYENKEKHEEALKICSEYDVVIYGSAPVLYIKERLRKGKLTFFYSERIYKKGVKFYKLLVHRIRNHFNINRFHNYYLLCASAYTASDYALAHAFVGKAFKWGYFPATKQYDINELMKLKISDKLHILWVGRLIKWKNPQYAILAAKTLASHNILNFEITIVGDGELKELLMEQVQILKLNKFVRFIGSVPSDSVRSFMEKANIFLFTSDKQEGWGAVLNEAMNSGCAVIANSEIGSVPYLINEGNNGCIYNGTEENFTEILLKIALDKGMQYKYGINAYRTVTNEWCAELAVDRLIKLSDYLLKNGPEKNVEIFNDGVCSRAD